MKCTKVYCENQGSLRNIAERIPETGRFMPVQHKLLLAWVFAAVIPFILQVRSYLKFVTPHKITESLVVPRGLEKETANLTDLCPVEGMLLSGSWFNIEPTHFFTVAQDRICHFVVPQYNVHGSFVIGSSKVEPYYTTPTTCKNDSVSYEQYFYHGSIGYYSFYEEQTGSFCPHDKTAYIGGKGLGTFDINGSLLAEDTGDTGYRQSYWYGVLGAIWIVYRGLVLRRSFIVCKRYGRICDEMDEDMTRKEAIVFVQENLRLAAHGATNYHRAAILYLLVESIMTDLFLLIANDGILAKIQYVSMGFNMSALLVMVFELIESTSCLREQWRVRIKRLLFSYETAFVGEILTAALQQYSLTLLNRTSLKESRPVAHAVSYYAWSLVGHGVFVLTIIALVISVRAFWATGYVWLSGGAWAIFYAPCSVDTALKLRSKMFLLGGYRWENNKLYYSTSALKALGVLRMEDEDGTELLVLGKIRWLTAKRDDLVVVGTISNQRVAPCIERPCGGIVTFWDRKLGGSLTRSEGRHPLYIHVHNKDEGATPTPINQAQG